MNSNVFVKVAYRRENNSLFVMAKPSHMNRS